jgi:hypothetical protein
VPHPRRAARPARHPPARGARAGSARPEPCRARRPAAVRRLHVHRRAAARAGRPARPGVARVPAARTARQRAAGGGRPRPVRGRRRGGGDDHGEHVPAGGGVAVRGVRRWAAAARGDGPACPRGGPRAAGRPVAGRRLGAPARGLRLARRGAPARAQIGGSLDLTGASIEDRHEGIALELSDAVIGGNLYLIPNQAGRPARLEGRLDLSGTRVSGQMLLRSASSCRPGRAAVTTAWSGPPRP